MQQALQVGTVKTWNKDAGWGFIEAESGRDFFVHHSDVLMDGYRELVVGDPVEFSVGPGKGGRMKAFNVRPF